MSVVSLSSVRTLAYRTIVVRRSIVIHERAVYISITTVILVQGQILLSDDADVAKKIVKDAKKAVKKSKVKGLISANDDGATFTVYTKSDGDIFTDIVVIIENEDPSGFVVITGDISQEKISEVVKIANM